MRPFKQGFATEIAFCEVGYNHARAKCAEAGIETTTLWVSGELGKDTGARWATYVCRRLGLTHLHVAVAGEYTDRQWSLGNLEDRGYGSMYS